MPIYEYRCGACETRFERFVRAFGEEVTCPECHGGDVEKQLSTFATTSAASGSGPAPAGGGGGCCGGGCGCAH